MRLIFLSIIIPVVFSFSKDFSFSDDQQQGSDSLNVRSSARQVTGDEIPLEPPSGQRCSGRNFQGRRCCTPENPCGLGEGDCDGPLDGGLNDGHEGCKGELVCGSNNCRKFGKYFHPKDDCCDEPSTLATERPPPVIVPGVPLEPPAGQRCTGRNFSGRRCCTPENPCDEGEGDCDGALDGGLNDGDKGCKGSLVCGSNNCKKFGSYYHEKDDCCEKAASSCSTDSGNYAAAPCIFPFTYNGVVRNQCIWHDAYNKHNQVFQDRLLSTLHYDLLLRRGAPQKWMLLGGTSQANGATVGLGALLMTIPRQRQCPGMRYSGASGACSGRARSSATVGRQQGTGSARESVAT